MLQLKNDLEEVKLTTLSEYEVDYSFSVDEPELPLGKHIFAKFCEKRAIDLTTQHGPEYGFAEWEQAGTTKIKGYLCYKTIFCYKVTFDV